MLIIPLCVGAYLIKTYFVRAAIQFERLNNTGRSPILVHTKSTLDGLITIRAAGRSSGIIETLVSEFHQKCDDHSKAFFNRISCQRWFGFRIDFMCFLYVFLSLFITIFLKGIIWLWFFENYGFFCCLFDLFFEDHFGINPGKMSILLIYIFQIFDLFQYCFYVLIEIEIMVRCLYIFNN